MRLIIKKIISFFLIVPILTVIISANTINETDTLSSKDVVEIGNPNQPEMLSKELINAYNNGARKIKVKAGIYNLPNPNIRNIFLLKNWSNAEVDMSGCTLIIGQDVENGAAFRLLQCENVTLKGGILIQTKQPAFQGEIVGVGKDEKNNITIDWKADAGYPIPDKNAKIFGSMSAAAAGLNVADRKTKKLIPGIRDIYNRKMESLENGLFRIFMDVPAISYGIGDVVLGRNGRTSFKIFLGESTNCTIRDFDLQRNGFSTIREDGGGGNKIINCKWSVGDKPVGATEESLVSATADGFHSTNTFQGALIEGCEFSGILLDDPIAIHSVFAETIFGTAGKEIVVKKEDLKLKSKIGDLLRTDIYPDVYITNIKESENTITYTVDKSTSIKPGTKFYNPMLCGPGAIIRNNKIGNTRSRGILLKGDDLLIENNIFDRCGLSAISLGPEDSKFGYEAGYVKNVVIKNNTFTNNGYLLNNKGIIYIHGQGVMGNSNIVIKDNNFINNYNTPFYITYANGVEIVNNQFNKVATNTNTANPNFVYVANSNNISLSNNKIDDGLSYKKPMVVIGKDVTNIRGNDDTGLITN